MAPATRMSSTGFRAYQPGTNPSNPDGIVTLPLTIRPYTTDPVTGSVVHNNSILAFGQKMTNRLFMSAFGSFTPFYPPADRRGAGAPRVAVANPIGVSSPATIVDQGNGVYEAKWGPLTQGRDLSLSIRMDGIPIPGSPFPLLLAPGPASAAASQLYGPGVTDIQCYKLTRTVAYLQLLDSYGNAVLLKNVSAWPPNIKPLRIVFSLQGGRVLADWSVNAPNVRPRASADAPFTAFNLSFPAWVLPSPGLLPPTPLSSFPAPSDPATVGTVVVTDLVDGSFAFEYTVPDVALYSIAVTWNDAAVAPGTPIEVEPVEPARIPFALAAAMLILAGLAVLFNLTLVILLIIYRKRFVSGVCVWVTNRCFLAAGLIFRLELFVAAFTSVCLIPCACYVWRPAPWWPSQSPICLWSAVWEQPSVRHPSRLCPSSATWR